MTMDQLIGGPLSHTHYWYEVGMLKVPAVHIEERRTAERRAADSVLIKKEDSTFCLHYSRKFGLRK